MAINEAVYKNIYFLLLDKFGGDWRAHKSSLFTQSFAR